MGGHIKHSYNTSSYIIKINFGFLRSCLCIGMKNVALVVGRFIAVSTVMMLMLTLYYRNKEGNYNKWSK